MFSDVSHAAAKVAVKKRIKRIADGPLVRMAVRMKKAFSNQSGDLGLPDLKRQATQSGASASAVEAHTLGACRLCR